MSGACRSSSDPGAGGGSSGWSAAVTSCVSSPGHLSRVLDHAIVTMTNETLRLQSCVQSQIAAGRRFGCAECTPPATHVREPDRVGYLKTAVSPGHTR